MIPLEVQQFRPPVDSYTAELPAGLIDQGETAEEARKNRGQRRWFWCEKRGKT